MAKPRKSKYRLWRSSQNPKKIIFGRDEAVAVGRNDGISVIEYGYIASIADLNLTSIKYDRSDYPVIAFLAKETEA